MGFGGWLKDRWGNGPSMNGLKSSVRGTGRFVTSDLGKGLAAGGLALTGVGLPAAAGLMGATQAAGSLASGKNIGQAAKSGALGAAGTFAGGKVASMLPGGTSIKNAVMGRLGFPTAALGETAAKAAGGNGFGWDDVGGFLKNNAGDLLQTAGNVWGASQMAKSANEDRDFMREQWEYQRGADEEERRRRFAAQDAVAPQQQALMRALMARFGIGA